MPDLAAYGPFAFGLIAALILWRAIVAPELAAARTTAATLSAIAESLDITSRRLERIAQTDHAGSSPDADARTHSAARHPAALTHSPFEGRERAG